MMSKFAIRKSADLSPCRTWRYTLRRVWDYNLPHVLFVLLNPSTADENLDDPTLRRGIGYAIKWKYGGVTFINLFAARTPDPKVMKAAPDPIGPDNDQWILKEAGLTRPGEGKIILAWGAHGGFLNRDKAVVRLLKSSRFKLWCMGLTKAGHPKHILYLKGDLEPVLYEVPNA